MDLLKFLDNSDNEPDYKFEEEDWFHCDSDTGDDIRDPNDNPDSLFQDVDKLPEPLKKKHFEEDLVYAMTMEHNNKNLILIILVKEENFL